ncbi:DUF928 domain-containing protein [Mastigocoleus testarum]|uniref:DUF928 domain-containing protein n=1 Tax=Mastigocoleus testarum BC008 TaxID=371196 RepID=A0A0V7ZPY8_9CYAN|nr:DUF928 domain-containing protein [Mastigocoleus testarum]KST66312.1 hypothetical protein BC008_25395 [Mastigocoleus testarum BC008]KST66633.1 hypothetical protein BC008_25920 [Mastigocoleus testarum BC008]
MNQIGITRLLVLFATTMSLQCGSIPNSIGQAQAQGATSEKTTNKQSKVTFKPRKGERKPKVTVGGGRRDNGMCEASEEISSLGVKSQTIDKTLVPLLPSSKLGLTASSHPSFMVYIPPTSAKAVEFTLENEEGEGIYQTEVNVANTPEIISFTLAKTEPGLEIDQDYRFVISIVCQQTGPKNPFVEGLVRRISPNSKLTNQLDKPKSLEQVILYSESGYWFEAVSNLAALKVSQPENLEIATAWESLLESVGLDAIAKTPLQHKGIQ